MFHQFAAHLHRGGAYAYYHVLPQRRSLWYALDDPPEIDPAKAKTNLYFGVHPCNQIPPANAHGEVRDPAWVRAQRPFIAAINCLFAEYDTKDYGDLPAILRHLDDLCIPPPSVVIASGGGAHSYWLLDDPYLLNDDARRTTATRVQAAWVALVGGDSGAHDLCRILRVPGSHNYKYNPSRPVTWLRANFDCVYPLRTLTAHIPPVSVCAVTPARIAPPIGGTRPIEAFNESHAVGDLLARYGYTWHGARKMLSPYSSTGQPGVTINTETNRAYCHHGSDPLHDGYWQRPFDVVRILDCGGDFRRALAKIKDDRI